MTIQFRDRALKEGEKSHYYCDECGIELHPDFAYSHKCNPYILKKVGGVRMTNTYKDNAPIEEKIYEETRCLRCVLERILRVMDEGLFVDYQMEKFGKDYKIKGELE
ncbi:MAG: hypothetical protein ACTSXD_08405 [Candidatus Heimdallarchaeaceae archaeon]